jgi:hypothetical protein
MIVVTSPFVAVLLVFLTITIFAICDKVKTERSYRLSHRLWTGEDKCQWDIESQFITGDLVSIDCHRVYEVLGRISETEYLVTYNRLLKKGHIVVHVSNINGIRINPEYLMQAGFSCPDYDPEDIRFDVPYKKVFKKDGTEVIITRSPKSTMLRNYWNVHLEHYDFVTPSKKNIVYIHELQHFLFGLGLNYREE